MSFATGRTCFECNLAFFSLLATNSMERPFKLEGFDKMSKQEVFPVPERLTRTLAEHFGSPE